jgi:hypothetical protein
MSAIIHIGTAIQALLQRHAGSNRLTEFAANRHRFPEHVSQPGGLGVFGDFGPTVDSGPDQRFAPDGIVVVAVSKDGELRADRMTTELGCNVGKSLEPVDVVAPHIGIRMTEMIEPPEGTGHARRDPHAGSRHCRAHLARKASRHRGGPRRVDEFVRELHVADFHLVRDGIDQITRLGEAIHQGIRVECERESHYRLE